VLAAETMEQLFQRLSISSVVNTTPVVRLQTHIQSFKINPEDLTYPPQFAPLFKNKFSEGPLQPKDKIFCKSVKTFMAPGLNPSTYKNFLHVLLYAQEYAEEDELHKCARFDGRAVICRRVNFILNRSNFIRGHGCIEEMTTSRIARLFPLKGALTVKVPSQFKLTKTDLLNKNIADNEEQFAAVNGILNATSGIYPYLLFGPPGTGKTVTLVEAISQVFFQNKAAKILVCAPSNTAANLLAVRLSENIPEASIMRGLSRTHKLENLPANLANISLIAPLWQKSIGQFHVVVTTLSSAGWINAPGRKKNQTNYVFSHVFIDEAGQSTETEALFAIARTTNSQSLLVLSGDPYQMGPVVKSEVAKHYRFEISLMERLMKTSSVYKKTGPKNQLDPRFITKLVKNFRSHEDLLEVPSFLFYDNELVACQPIHNFYLKTAFPLIFHGVLGAHSRDPKSTSLFNSQEVNEVLTYIDKLRWIFPDEEIGIISPYRSQVRHIKKRLGETSIMVGSTEEYQGQERRVILISTVRSSLGLETALNNAKQAPSLGFLTSERRFNVAVTRAKELMLIIGDPDLLSKEPNWKLLIDFIILNGGYTGCKYQRATQLLGGTRI
ncbi:hypothetical protein TCAL_10783, partial [Tigriopus californicus]